MLRKESGDSDEETNSSNGDVDEQDEWEGFAEPPAVDYEAEYIDEDKYTTVTVEEMDASREGLLRAAEGDKSDEDEDERTKRRSEADVKSTTTNSAEKKMKEKSKPKKKKKKFRYESKEERKVTLMKQRQAKSRKAKVRRERG